MQIRTALTAAVASTALVGTGWLVSREVNLLPVAASTNAPPYDSLFQVLFSIGTTLFLGILIVLLYSLVRFRRRPGEVADGPPIEGNLPLEIVWTAIPAVVILFVGIYSYDIYDRMGGMANLGHGGMDHSGMDHSAMDHSAMPLESMGSDSVAVAEASAADGFTPAAATAAPPVSSNPPAERVWGGIGSAGIATPSLPVEVTAMQFAFIFHYPEGDITSGELHVPLGQAVQLRMEARDVIHAFWVPEFRLKQDVIPGQPTVLSFTATRAGTYPVICAELCGPYHGGMRTSVVVHEPDDFRSWVTQNTPATTA